MNYVQPTGAYIEPTLVLLELFDRASRSPELCSKLLIGLSAKQWILAIFSANILKIVL